MIELIPNCPDDVLGVVASGHVTARDYETVVVPAVEAALKAHGSVRMLYQLGTAFTGFSTGAMWDDMKLGLSHRQAWERIAVVTDHEWVAAAIGLFRFMVPCPLKVFPNADFAEAVHWVATP